MAASLSRPEAGAYLLAFGGTRTYHRMACAIEDAGFEIRDCIQWLYGNGFPKSHDVCKGIDRAAGAEREVIGSSIATLAANKLHTEAVYNGDQVASRESNCPRHRCRPSMGRLGHRAQARM